MLGIDLSSRMIEKAKRFGEDRRISYQVCDLESHEYPTETWDCVVSNLALHYVEDLGRHLSENLSHAAAGWDFSVQYRTPGVYRRCGAGLA